MNNNLFNELKAIINADDIQIKEIKGNNKLVVLEISSKSKELKIIAERDGDNVTLPCLICSLNCEQEMQLINVIRSVFGLKELD